MSEMNEQNKISGRVNSSLFCSDVGCHDVKNFQLPDLESVNFKGSTEEQRFSAHNTDVYGSLCSKVEIHSEKLARYQYVVDGYDDLVKDVRNIEAKVSVVENKMLTLATLEDLEKGKAEIYKDDVSFWKKGAFFLSGGLVLHVLQSIADKVFK